MTKKNTPKNQHHIPKMILKNFVDANDQIYFFDAQTRKGAYRSTETVAAEKHLYTMWSNKDRSDADYSLEEQFSKEENAAALAIAKALQGEDIDKDELGSICKLMVSLFLRPPKYVRMTALTGQQEDLKALLVAHAKTNNFPDEEVKETLQKISERRNYVFARTFPTLHANYWESFVNRFDIYLIKSESGVQFLLNDNFVIIDSKERTFKPEEVDNWLDILSGLHCPIAANVCLSFIPKEEQARIGSGRIIFQNAVMPADEVQRINELSYRQKERYLYANNELEIRRIEKKILKRKLNSFKNRMLSATAL